MKKWSYISFLLLALSTNSPLRSMNLSGDLTQLQEKLGNLKLKLTELSTTLEQLKESLNPKAPPVHPSAPPPHTSTTPPTPPNISTPLENRIYEKDSKRILIDFIDADIKDAFAKRYNLTPPASGGLIDPANTHVVGGPFTYYGEKPPRYANHDKDPHNDIGWGCAWRASLNVLNKVKWWLEQRKIIAQGEFSKRLLDMYDVARWMNWEGTNLPAGGANWIEPPNNAELYLQFVEDCFSSDDQKKIHELLDFRGRLYLGTLERTAKIDAMEAFQIHRSELLHLRKHFKLPSDASDLTRKQALERLFPIEYTFNNKQPMLTQNFPAFDESKNPFPVHFDDGTYAQNIYGIHTNGNEVMHIFVGETHIWDTQNPWLRSEWRPIESFFFQSNNIMMFEVFLREKSQPAPTSEYTLEEFQKLLETTPPHSTHSKIPSTPGPLSSSAISDYSKQEFSQFIKDCRKLPRLLIPNTDPTTIRIKVNQQSQYHSCGYHALCNSLHFFNVFKQKKFSVFPDEGDYDFFNTHYNSWYLIVLKESKKLVPARLAKAINIKNEDSGDLTPIVFDMIKEGDSDIKKLWDDGVLIYFPYSSTYHSIINLDIDLAHHYDLCIQKFYANNQGILIWNLGLKEHFYTLCAIRVQNKLIKLVCDSENTKTLLLKDQGGTIITTIDGFLRNNQSFRDFYALRLVAEIEENRINFTEVLRLLQSTPTIVDYYKSFSDTNKKLIAAKIKTDALTNPMINYDLIPENKRDIRSARATFVIKNLFENNSDIDQRIHVEAFETDKIYYLHYKDEDTATKKPGSKDRSDYCFKTTINPKTIAEKPAYSKFDESIKVGEPKLIPTT